MNNFLILSAMSVALLSCGNVKNKDRNDVGNLSGAEVGKLSPVKHDVVPSVWAPNTSSFECAVELAKEVLSGTSYPIVAYSSEVSRGLLPSWYIVQATGVNDGAPLEVAIHVWQNDVYCYFGKSLMPGLSVLTVKKGNHTVAEIRTHRIGFVEGTDGHTLWEARPQR